MKQTARMVFCLLVLVSWGLSACKKDETSEPKQKAQVLRPLFSEVITASSAARVQTQVILQGHHERVFSVGFSPDGQILASGGGATDGTIRLWNVMTGEELRVLKGHMRIVYTVVFSPDGKRLASASDDGTLRLWDVQSGKELKVLRGPANMFYDVAFSPDGKLLASADSEIAIRLWDVESGEQIAELPSDTWSFETVAFTPDGKQLLGGTANGDLQVWDVQTRQLVAVLFDLDGSITDLSLSRDGSKLATVCVDLSVQVWDMALNQRLGGTRPSYSVAFNPDSSLLAISTEDIRLFDLSTGKNVATLSGHTDIAMGLAFSPDGKILASASLDGTVRLWGISSSTMTSTPVVINGQPVDPLVDTMPLLLTDLAQPPTATLGSPPAPATAAPPTQTSAPPTITPFPVAINPLPSTPITANRAADLELLAVLPGEEEHGMQSVAFNPAGTLLAAGGFGRVQVWNIVSGEKIYDLDTSYSSEPNSATFAGMDAVVFSPDGSLLAACGGERLWLWEASTGTLLYERELPLNGSEDMVFSPDGSQLVTGSTEGPLSRWDVPSGEPIDSLTGHSQTVSDLEFSPDGTRLASSSYDGTVRLWDAVTSAEQWVLPGQSGQVFWIAFTPDGSRLLSSLGDIWNPTTGEHLDTRYYGAETFAFSRDGSLMVMASSGGEADLFSTSQGEKLHTLIVGAFETRINQIVFNPDGTLLATASADGIVRLWGIR